MPLCSRINRALFGATAALGHALWRRTLRARRDAALTQLRHACDGGGPARRYACTVAWRAWAGGSGLREALAGGRAQPRRAADLTHPDSLVGSAWDRGPAPPGAPPRPDIDRFDLGWLHRRGAQALGGSDAAVLAVHLGLLPLRLGRHALVGAITGLGMLPPGIYAALWEGPRAARGRWRPPPPPAGGALPGAAPPAPADSAARC